MELKKINNQHCNDFKEIWTIYKSSFPFDERRSLKQQLKLFKNKRYSFFAVYEIKSLVGIITLWNLNNCIFIEHLAVKRNLTGRGIGTKLLKEFISKHKKTIILEVERAKSEANKRRISFYKRLGFKLNKHLYTQPSYAKSKSPVPMFLMAYPHKISKPKFSKVREEIHTSAYGCKKAILK